MASAPQAGIGTGGQETGGRGGKNVAPVGVVKSGVEPNSLVKGTVGQPGK